ncbi:MAG: DNA polymerase III subunit gamma/tau [Alphaproteobacteria bacterium]|nr:DNA polymerase III subunit gamma/tau [Alphaproteobacteria bacterium]
MPNLFGETPTDQPAAVTPYRVLARKYRPSTFAELIGQEAMVRTLTNAIHSGRLPQAWMLTGVRGIGKTTTARLIAKALNCTGRDPLSSTIEPCGVCDSCRAIAEDRHVDVQEMDAASRTGVDDIREIVEGVRYGPVSAKYKIYILDEVHMLSKNAFNALLKTLEEPPPHTKFIFATTEIRKVPVTVLSRCQRFDLRRIESADLAAHFMRLAELEEVSAEAEAIKLIAHAADGSVRDGLSLLDQAIALGNGAITEAEVKDMLGLADRAASLVLCRQVLRGEMREALASFDGMVQAGTDPFQILQDMAELIHRLTRAQIITEGTEFADLPEAERQMVSDLGEIKIPALSRAWQILLKGIGEVQSVAQPTMAAEMVLVRLAYAAQLPPPGDLIKQLREQMAATKADGNGTPSGGGGGSSSSRFGSIVSSSGGGSARVLQAAPSVEAVAQQAVAMLPTPTTFRELVALFAEHREGGLYAELCSYAHPVRMTMGKLEIRLRKDAAAHLVPRVNQCLNQWTGQRWMVAVVDEAGGPTLAEEDRERERLRRERAEAHPLMQALRQSFPEAKVVSLKQKEVAPIVAAVDDADEILVIDADEDE